MVGRHELEDKSLSEVADIMARGMPGSIDAHIGQTELQRRQTAAQIEAANSTKRAAWAGVAAAIAGLIAALAAMITVIR